MLRFRVNSRRPSPQQLRQVGALLRRGGVVVYPTDTAYALGGVYNRRAVVRRALYIKGRRDPKFTLVAASLAQAERFFHLSPAARKLAARHWPGPLSIVVSRRFAVRVPRHSVARHLARLAGAPLIATSANRSGGRTPYTQASVMRQFGGRHQPDAILDAGRLPQRKPSTIVAVDGRGRITLIRKGAVSLAGVKRKAQKRRMNS